NANYAPSQFNVAVMYSKGEVVQKSIQESIKWYNKALSQNDPRAAYNLGALYEKGKDVEKDLNKAYRYYELAYEMGLDIAKTKLDELKVEDSK
ncbi:tetratricopeptide repeat protein, partial [Escherichia coli]|uniref:tetratricopeptide repeat protein n=2 Tax=Gammaproteobacteria TaxID=1236 RepID=UPI001444551C